MIIGFKVTDPRLRSDIFIHIYHWLTHTWVASFPPKNAKSKSDVVRNAITIPSDQLAQCEIWDENVRLKLKKPRYKKMDLDLRRSKVLP